MSLIYSEIGTRIQSAGATTLAPVLPTATGKTEGIFVAIVNINSNDSISTATSGWTKVRQTHITSFAQAIFMAPIGSVSPVFTWSTSVQSASFVIYVEGSKGLLQSNAIGTASTGFGTVNPHTNDGLTTTRSWSFALMIDSVATYSVAFTTNPSGWNLLSKNGSYTENMATVISSKNLGIGPAVATGAISTPGTSATANWINDVIEIQYISSIYDTGIATSVDVVETEIGSWMIPGSGLTVGDVEMTPWVVPGIGVAVGDVEITIWAKLSTYVPRRGLIIN